MVDSGRAPSGQALVASDEARSDLHPTGFDPSRVGGVTASNYDPAYEAALMLPRLDAEQRDFILRARPHRRDQRLSAKDWHTVFPGIDLCDWPPYTIWFGGMRAHSGAGQKGWKRTFRFNEAGLLLRAAIAMEARSVETEGLHPKDDSAGAKHIAQQPTNSSGGRE